MLLMEVFTVVIRFQICIFDILNTAYKQSQMGIVGL